MQSAAPLRCAGRARRRAPSIGVSGISCLNVPRVIMYASLFGKSFGQIVGVLKGVLTVLYNFIFQLKTDGSFTW